MFKRIIKRVEKFATSLEYCEVSGKTSPSFLYRSAIIDNDLDFLPTALGDVAKAHGITKLAEGTGINRRTLYKVFDKNSNPSFELVTNIMSYLGLSIQVKPKVEKQKNKRKKAG